MSDATRHVITHSGLDAMWSHPEGAAADLFARGGVVSEYTFTVVPDVDRPILRFWMSNGVELTRYEKDFLYVDIPSSRTAEDVLNVLRTAFGEESMPGRSFCSLSCAELKKWRADSYAGPTR